MNYYEKKKIGKFEIAFYNMLKTHFPNYTVPKGYHEKEALKGLSCDICECLRTLKCGGKHLHGINIFSCIGQKYLTQTANKRPRGYELN